MMQRLARCAPISVAVAVLAAVLWTSCASRRPALRWTAPPGQPPAATYSAVAKQWTRDGRVIQRFLTVLDARALLRSWPVRDAWLSTLQARKGTTPAEHERLRREDAAACLAQFEVLVSVSSDQDDWSQLDQAGGLWNLTLENEAGLAVRPLTVEEYTAEPGVLWEFFPNVSPWDRTYVIRFPTAAAGGVPLLSQPGRHTLSLHFRSILAHLRLNWDLKSD